MRRLTYLIWLSGTLLPAVAAAAPDSTSAAGAARTDVVEAREAGTRAYQDHSDQALTALAADWDSLDRHQRRALLTEMKLRMARKGEREGVLHIRTERRYGRIIRQPDGRVIRIETQVVHVRPVNPEDLEARASFGVGFENRVGHRDESMTRAAASRQTEGDARSGQPAGDSGADGFGDVLRSLRPSTRAPALERLPVYQASDPTPDRQP